MKKIKSFAILTMGNQDLLYILHTLRTRATTWSLGGSASIGTKVDPKIEPLTLIKYRGPDTILGPAIAQTRINWTKQAHKSKLLVCTKSAGEN